MAAPSPAPSTGTAVGRYRLLEQIGIGAMGVVYRAFDERLRREVAIKVLPAADSLDEQARWRFRKTALLLSKLNHPCIAGIYDFDSESGRDFLVMELVHGVTLEERIQCRPLSEAEVIEIGCALGRALEEAHRHGVIHRDLKPTNVMITPAGNVKVLDFGLATLTRPLVPTLDSVTTVADVNALAGTLPYVAPEHLSGRPADERSDIYCLGATLYEMATGERPFSNVEGLALVRAVLDMSVLTPGEISRRHSPQLEAVIAKCLEKRPEDRYQTAAEVAHQLQALQTGSPGALPARVSLPTLRAPLAIVLLFVLAAALAFVWRRHSWFSPAHNPRTLAVLPFTGPANDASVRSFSEGLTETLATKLTRLSDKHSLEVIDPAEVRRQGVQSPRDANQSLGVDLAIEGNVQQSGSLVRVNYMLVDAHKLRPLTSGTVDASQANPFTLEDQVIARVLDSLTIELNASERAALEQRGTSQPTAYDFYLQGRGYLSEPQLPAKVESAVTVFNHALQVDPQFGLAYAGLGEAYWQKFRLTGEKRWADEAVTQCQKASTVAPNAVDSYLCLGTVLTGTGHYEAAVDQFRRAADLQPENDEAVRGLATAYAGLGKFPLAEDAYRQAIRLRPQYWVNYSWLGAFYAQQARYHDAEQMFSSVIALAPDSFKGYFNLSAVLIQEGRYNDAVSAARRSIAIYPTAKAYSNVGTAQFALREFNAAAQSYEKSVELNPRDWMSWGNLGDARYWAPSMRPQAAATYRKAIDTVEEALRVNPRDSRALSYLATYHAMLGERNSAFAALQKALELAPDNAEVAFRAAIVFNQTGDTTKAIDYLESAVREQWPVQMIRDTPDFDHLRGNPRFEALLK